MNEETFSTDRIHFGCAHSIHPERVCFYTKQAFLLDHQDLFRGQLKKITQRVRNDDREMQMEAHALYTWIMDNTWTRDLSNSTWRSIDKLTAALNSVKTEPRRSNAMNLKNAAALIRNDITTITVRHDNGKHYTYKCLRSLAKSLVPNESIVVVHNARGYTLGTVTHIDSEPEIAPDAGFEYRWAFQRVRQHTAERLEAQDERIAHKLEKRKAASYRNQILAQLGINSDEVKALLTQVEELES